VIGGRLKEGGRSAENCPVDLRLRSLLAGIGAGTMLVAAGCVGLLLLSAGVAWKGWPADVTTARPAIALSPAPAPRVTPAGTRPVAQTGPVIVVRSTRALTPSRRSAKNATTSRRAARHRKARAAARRPAAPATPRVAAAASAAPAPAATPSGKVPPGQAKKATGSNGAATRTVRKAAHQTQKAAVSGGAKDAAKAAKKAAKDAAKAAKKAAKDAAKAAKSVAKIAAKAARTK
jgi:hypothetical protein